MFSTTHKISHYFFFVLFFSFFYSEGQTVKLLSSGQSFKFLEGPVWDGNKNLYFTDINDNKIIKYNTLNKTFNPITTNSSSSNGLMFNTENNLVVCEGGSGKVVIRDTTGMVLEILTSAYKNIRFSSPNDLCLDSKAGIYFTDPTWGTQHQSKNRLYYLSPTKTVIELVDDMQKPNGVILSRDGNKLYVNDSWNAIVRVYDVMNDGRITNQQTFATLELPSANATSGADGMTIDIDGNVYITSAIGIQVFDKNGVALKTLTFPETPSNCTFGGPDMTTLFVTARKNLYSVELPTRGLRYPFDFDNITATYSNLTETKLSIWPNPTHSKKTTIQLSNGKLETATISLYNFNGEEINQSHYTIKTNHIYFDVEMEQGVYFLKINSSTVKLILQ